MNHIEIDVQTFRLRLLKLCVRSGALGLPRDPVERHVVLKAVTLALEHRPYDRADLTAALEGWLAGAGRRIETDHVALRRALVDYGYLDRDPGGERYELLPGGPSSVCFGAGVADVDVEALVTRERERVEERRLAHLAAQGNRAPRRTGEPGAPAGRDSRGTGGESLDGD